MPSPHVDTEARPDVHVLLKVTYPQGQAVLELSKAAARRLSERLAHVVQGDPDEVELRGPGRYVGSDTMDEVQAQAALHQTLGLIERAGFEVSYEHGPKLFADGLRVSKR